MNSSAMDKEAAQHLPGFDYLRAIMACTVIVWHTNLFTPSEMPPLDGSFRTCLSLYFLLLPVPAFFMISSFLFSLKVGQNSRYIFARIEKLAYLYLFWSSLWIVTNFNSGIAKVKATLGMSFWIALSFFCCWGIGAYYFFFSLLVITVLIVFSSRLPRQVLWVLLGISLVYLTGVKAYVFSHEHLIYLNLDSIPTNFLAFVFAGPLAAYYYKKGYFEPNGKRLRTVLLLVSAAYIASVILEQVVLSSFEIPKIPHYSRPAPTIGAILAFTISLAIQRPPGRVIRFLADHSLGIYCTHPLLKVTYIIFAGYEPRGDLVYTLTILFSSILASVVLRRAFSRGLI
ncbi:MAG: acyltransferase [Proteobacteria bacterium]|nr:acyltransferase [Pseudomonadota bacterium]